MTKDKSTIKAKLISIANLLQGHDPDLALDEIDFFGISQIIHEIADDLETI